MEKLSITEYASKVWKSREAIFYQIKKWKLNSFQDKNTKQHFIFIEKKEKIKDNKNKWNWFNLEFLKKDIELLKIKIEWKDLLIYEKEKRIKSEEKLNQSLTFLVQKLENENIKFLNLKNWNKNIFFDKIKQFFKKY
jgi:hypothetical protein